MRLIYFTNSFPYGIGEQWKSNELIELVNYFDSITVVPLHYDNNFDNPKPLPNGVSTILPLLASYKSKIAKIDILRILFHKHRLTFFKEFFNRKVYLKKSHLVSWLESTMLIIKLLNHSSIKQIINESDKEAVFYFYWGKGSCEFMPFITSGITIHKSMVRMHRYDLFEYANNNYIPYRKNLLKTIDIIAPSSEAGKIHLDTLYPEFSNKTRVVRCGTKGNGKYSSPSNDGICRVVSCSFLSPVKRVHLMIECLQYIDFPIKWYHVGDGLLRSELEKLISSLNLRDKFIFEGMKDSREVLNYYSENCFDLFINVSESEGVPFSIMEAFSVGIPVLATDVGGTGEIVDDTVGGKLSAKIHPIQLAAAIKYFRNKTTAEKLNIRQNAFNRYNTQCNAVKLSNELGSFLISD